MGKVRTRSRTLAHAQVHCSVGEKMVIYLWFPGPAKAIDTTCMGTDKKTKEQKERVSKASLVSFPACEGMSQSIRPFVARSDPGSRKQALHCALRLLPVLEDPSAAGDGEGTVCT